MRAPFKKILMARYVTFLEFFGYSLAAILLTLWVTFFFIRIDEHCFGPGEARPAVLEITTDDVAVLDEIIASDGSWVEKDQPLLVLNHDPKAVAARQAQADVESLGKQIVTLADDRETRTELENSLSMLIDSIGNLDTGESIRTLASPEAGLLHIIAPATVANPVVEGLLAQVISNRILQADLTLGTLNRERVAEDQPVKITLRVDGGRRKINLVGSVLSVGPGAQAVVQASLGEEHSELAGLLARRITHSDQAEDLVRAEARIVVGNQRLVSFLFNRPSPPPKPGGDDEDAKKAGIFRRFWQRLRGR